MFTIITEPRTFICLPLQFKTSLNLKSYISAKMNLIRKSVIKRFRTYSNECSIVIHVYLEFSARNSTEVSIISISVTNSDLNSIKRAVIRKIF